MRWIRLEEFQLVITSAGVPVLSKRTMQCFFFHSANAGKMER